MYNAGSQRRLNGAFEQAPATPLAAMASNTFDPQDTCGQWEARGGRSAGESQPQA